jgi:hypothetical protein
MQLAQEGPRASMNDVQSGLKKARPSRRVLAKFVDLLFVMVVSVAIWSPVGPLIGFLYSIMADGLPFEGFEGQSLGKKLFKLRVISTRAGAWRGGDQPVRLSLRDSIFRNAPVGVATFFALIPVWGWAILALIGFPLMVVEIYLLVRAPRGQRLGDVMGDTEVVEI